MKIVLLAEDDEADIQAMKMACERTGIPHRLQIVTDGDMAIRYLSGEDPFTERLACPLPDLVFLDIKLPKRSGHEVLAWIRSQPAIASIPVVMLTGTDLMKDVERAYKLGATSYLQKATSPSEVLEAVRIVLNYWLQLNIAPR
jgi:CheY-like chemotaxis protein